MVGKIEKQYRPQVIATSLMALSKEPKKLKSSLPKLAELLVQKKLTKLLPKIEEELKKLELAKRNSVEALVTTATNLNHGAITEIEKFVKHHYGVSCVEMRISIEPGLIGGAKLQVGDDSFDMSVRSSVDQLTYNLTHTK